MARVHTWAAPLGAGPDLYTGDRGPDWELKMDYTVVIVIHNTKQIFSRTLEKVTEVYVPWRFC